MNPTPNTNSSGQGKWISMSEAALLTPYSAEYLSLRARKGKLASKKINNVWYTTKGSVDSYMNKQMLRTQLASGVASAPMPEASDPVTGAAVPLEKKVELQSLRTYQSDVRAFMENEGLLISDKNSTEAFQNRPRFNKHVSKVSNDYLSDEDKISSSKRNIITDSVSSLHRPAFQDIEKALEKILDRKISTPQKVTKATEIPRRSWKVVTKSRLLMGATLVTLILLTAFPVPFVFSTFEKSWDYMKGTFTDANTIMGFRPGTSENEILLLNKEGNVVIAGHIETGGQLISRIKDGVAPIVVDSRTEVPNLNAELVGGFTPTEFTLAFVTKNGNITTEDVVLNGEVKVGETLLVKGATKLLSALRVEGDLSVFGNAEFNQALTALGPAYFKALLTAEGDIVGKGSLTIEKDIKGNGNLNIKNITARGSITSGSAVIGKNGSFESLGVSGNLSAGGKIVLGRSTEEIIVTSENFTLDRDGDTRIFGSLQVDGELTAPGLTLTGTSTLANLTVTGATTLNTITAGSGTTTNATSTNFFATTLRSALATITNLVATDISTSALTSTNSTSTNATTTSLFATTASSSNLFFTQANGGNITSSGLGTFSNILSLGSSTLQNFSALNSTSTNATTTSFFTTTGRITNLFFTDSSGSTQTLSGLLTAGNILVTGSSTLQNLTFINATGSSATTTNLFSTNGRFTSLIADAQTITNLLFTNATGTSATTTSLFSTTASSTNLFSTNANLGALTAGTISAGPITSGLINGQTISSAANFTGTLTATGGLSTLSNLLLTGSSTLQNFTGLNSTLTNATTTSLFSTNGTFTNLFGTNNTFTNAVITNSTTTNATSTNFFATNTVFANVTSVYETVTDLIFSRATGTSATTTNFFSTTASSTNLFSTNANLGALTAGTISAGPITSGLINGQTISSAANFTGSLTAGSITSGLINGQTISSAANFTGTLTATGGLSTLSNLLLTGSSTLQNFTFVNATGTNATTTNFFATTASSTNLFFTQANGGNLTSSGLGTFSNILSLGSTTLQNFTALNSTSTSATSTNFFTTTGRITTLYFTDSSGSTQTLSGLLTAGNILATGPSTLQNFTGLNSTTTNATSTSLFSSTGSFTNLLSTNNTLTNLIFTLATGTSATTTNFFSTNGAFGTLRTTGNVTVGGSISVTGSFASSITNGQFQLLATPTGTNINEGSVYINPTTAGTNNVLLGIAVNGTEKVRIDAEGDIQITGLFNSTNTSGINSFSGGLSVNGNTTLGDNAADTLTLVSKIGSSLLPSVDTTYDLGSATFRWNNIYAGTTTIDNLVAGGTASSTFIINQTNTTADTQDSSLEFERGTLSPNAILKWDATNDRFDFNDFPVRLQNKLVVSGTASSSIAGPLWITGTPQGTGLRDATLYINPGSASANNSLFSVGVADVERFKIDAEGDTTIQASLGIENALYDITDDTLTINDKLQLNGNEIKDSGGITRLSLGTTNAFTGSLTLTGSISGGTTITGTTINGTTGINTGASAGTQRIDASGNLLNIGTITSGLINGQTISSAANFTGTLTATGGLSTLSNLLLTGSSTLQNFTFLNATGTSATTTNFFATTASSTNLFSSLLTVGGNGLIVNSNRNVGIGTGNPVGGRLSVNGVIHGYGGNGGYGEINLSSNEANTAGRFQIRSDSSDGITGWKLKDVDGLPMIFGTSNAPRITIAAAGNVGIGTIAPSKKFQVVGGSDTWTGLALGDNGVDIPTLSFRVSDNSERAKIEVNGVNGVGGDRLGLFAFSGGALNEVVSVKGGGNVGISTTTPQNRLTVSGTAQATTAFSVDAMTSGSADASLFLNGYNSGSKKLTELRANYNGGLVVLPNVTDPTVTIGAPSPGNGNTLGVVGKVAIGSTFYATAAPTNGLIVEGNVGIGTTSPATTLSVSGSGYLTGGLGIGVLNTTSGTLQTSGLANIGTSLTIGTTLTVTGGLTSLSNLLLSGSSTLQNFTFLNATGSSATTTNFFATTASSTNLFSSLLTVGGNGLVVDANRNVGIGTSAPTQKLQIFSESGTTGNPTLSIKDNNGGGELWLRAVGGTGTYVGTTNNIPLQFYANNSEVGRFTTAGNLGIGTTSPEVKLDVWQSGSNLTAQFIRNQVGSQSSVRFGNLSRKWDLTIAGDGTQALKFTDVMTGATPFQIEGGSGVNDSLVITASGNIGLSTTTPNNKLDIYSATKAAIGFSGASGSTYKWTVGMDVANGGRFSIASSTALGTLDRFVIDGNGNVGIGTTNSGALLQIGSLTGVAGNVYVRGPGDLRIDMQGAAGGSTQGLSASGIDMITRNNDTGALSLSTNANASILILPNGTGKVGIGSTTPWGLLSVNANGLASGVPQFVVGSSTATNFIVSNGGNVGVGTTSPWKNFSVSGTVGLTGLETSADNDTYKILVQKNDGTLITDTFLLWNPGGDSLVVGNGGLVLTGSQIRTSGSNTLTLTNGDGNAALLLNPNGGAVGVGTTLPEGKLHIFSGSAGTVTADSNVDDLVIENSTGGGLNILTPDNAYKQIAFGGPAGAYKGIISYGGPSVGTAADQNAMAFFTNYTADSADMVINSSGNVGIGSTTPFGQLGIVNGIANQASIISTGYSLTGSNASSLLDFSGTWNTTGSPTAIKTNITGTAFNTTTGNSRLIDLQVSDSSKFRVAYSSAVGEWFGYFAGGLAIGNASTPTSSGGINVNVGTNSVPLALTGGGDPGGAQINLTNFSTGNTSSIGWNASSISLNPAVVGVGISTSSPNNKLDIYSTTKSAIGFSGASGSTYKWTMGMDVTNGGRFSIASSTALGTLDRFVIDGNGNVGIGTTTPWGQLSVNPNGITGPSFVIGSSTVTQFIVTNSGRVGINTSAPTYGLNISKPTGATGTFSFTDGTRTLTDGSNGVLSWNAATHLGGGSFAGIGDTELYGLGDGSNRVSLYVKGSGTGDVLGVVDSSSNSLFKVTAGGNVGIGTTSPYQKLSVAGNVIADSFIATSTTATSTIAGFLDVNGTGSNATSSFASNLWVKGTLRTGINSLYLNDTSINAGNGGFSLNTTGNSYVNGVSGNFGIGTTTPQWKVQVVDATRPQLNLSDGVSNPWNFRSVGGNLYIATSSLTTFATTTNPVLTLNTAGQLGLGTSTPAYGIDVQLASATMNVETSAVTYATGGTVTDVGGYRIHTFTSSGSTTFTPTTSLTVDVLVIAGGGGGGGSWAGGGGGGGFVEQSSRSATAQAYTVTVGAGGGGTGCAGSAGSNSVFDTITANGGGGGSGYICGTGTTGGSGGGGSYQAAPNNDGFAATQGNSGGGTGYGNAGGNGGSVNSSYAGAGGGGAGGVAASNANTGAGGTENNGTAGGSGRASSISGSSVTYAGGGGGGGSGSGGAGGSGGGGAGSGSGTSCGASATSGTANTGGGGGGYGGNATYTCSGGTGGSGIVIVRYALPATKKFRIDSSGYVAVGTLASATSNTLCYNTTAISGMNTLSTCSSSERYKEDIQNLVVDKEALFKLNPVNFKWKDRDEREPGLIAERVAEILPDLTFQKDGVVEGVRYQLIPVYLLSVVKDMDRAFASSTASTTLAFGNIDLRLNAMEELASTTNATTTARFNRIASIFGLALDDVSTSALDIAEGMTVRGAFKIDRVGAIGDILSLESDVDFIGRPYFNSDTGGIVEVEPGSRKVDVVFDKPYINAPVVNSTLSLDATSTDAQIESILGANVSYAVTARSQTGFSILLSKPAPEKMTFSWTALAIKNMKIGNSINTIQPASPSTSSGPTAPPTIEIISGNAETSTSTPPIEASTLSGSVSEPPGEQLVPPIVLAEPIVEVQPVLAPEPVVTSEPPLPTP